MPLEPVLSQTCVESKGIVGIGFVPLIVGCRLHNQNLQCRNIRRRELTHEPDQNPEVGAQHGHPDTRRDSAELGRG